MVSKEALIQVCILIQLLLKLPPATCNPGPDALINRLLDVQLDTIQYSGGSEGNLVEYKTIASLPNVSHRNEDYMMEGDTTPLTISNVIEVKGKEGLPGIINGKRGPEELENGALPNRCLGWAFKEEVIYGIIYCGAHCTHWRQVDRRKYAVQQELMRECCSDPSLYPLKLPLTSRDLFKFVQKIPKILAWKQAVVDHKVGLR